MEHALDKALLGLILDQVDGAAVQLAREYAQAIDAGSALDVLGPKMLSVLESLGMSPRARAAITKEANRDAGPSPLDELRARRDAR